MSSRRPSLLRTVRGSERVIRFEWDGWSAAGPWGATGTLQGDTLLGRRWREQLTPPIHRRAERLMLSLAVPLRALDALHLATALDAEAATVVTFDPRLRDAAGSQGLFVAPPNT